VTQQQVTLHELMLFLSRVARTLRDEADALEACDMPAADVEIVRRLARESSRYVAKIARGMSISQLGQLVHPGGVVAEHVRRSEDDER
jgi:hypothetical protein